MSDNKQQPHPPLQLGVLGFSDEPGEPGLVDDGTSGTSAIHQRWSALGASQIHPADPDPATATANGATANDATANGL